MEGDGDDSALRRDTGEIEDFDIQNLFNVTEGDPCDIVDNGQELREEENSLVTAMGTEETVTLSEHYERMRTQDNIVTDPVSDGGQELWKCQARGRWS